MWQAYDNISAQTLLVRGAESDLLSPQTAHAMSDERDKCFAAGMVGHIAKPINQDELVRQVLQFLEPL